MVILSLSGPIIRLFPRRRKVSRIDHSIIGRRQAADVSDV
jgi:hypothetical protein